MTFLQKLILLALAWWASFGVWPWADPGHDADSFLSRLDLAIHLGAITLAVLLLMEWWK